jgi:hypothetical protein
MATTLMNATVNTIVDRNSSCCRSVYTSNTTIDDTNNTYNEHVTDIMFYQHCIQYVRINNRIPSVWIQILGGQRQHQRKYKR